MLKPLLLLHLADVGFRHCRNVDALDALAIRELEGSESVASYGTVQGEFYP